MKTILSCTSFGRWLNLPVGLLLVFLQRTPVLRVASEAAEALVRWPAADTFRGLASLAVALGAVDTLAGATELVATPSNTLTAAAGNAVQAVFNISGAPGGKKPMSWEISSGTLPPGTYLASTSSATSGVTTGSLDVSSSGITAGNLYLLGTPTTPGSYQFSLQAWEGSNRSGNVGGPYLIRVTVTGNAAVPPTLTAHPLSATQVAGTALTLSVAATGSNLTYQWRKNGTDLPGATQASLAFASLAASDAATYTVVVSSGTASTTSRPAVVQVATPVQGELINLAILGVAGRGGSPLTVGFVANGRQLLVRAAGPALAAPPFGVAAAMADPILSYSPPGATIPLAVNDNWSSATNVAEVRSAIANHTGFPFVEGSKDSALVVEGSGERTAQVNSVTNQAGVVLVEAYALPSGSGRLKNVSTLNYGGSGSETITLGFVISGNVPVPLLIRGVGPRIVPPPFNVTDAMLDPRIVLFDHAVRNIASNDNWEDEPGAGQASRDWTGLQLEAGSKDAALVVTLAPGAYTVQLTPASGSGGRALVELYELRP